MTVGDIALLGSDLGQVCNRLRSTTQPFVARSGHGELSFVKVQKDRSRIDA